MPHCVPHPAPPKAKGESGPSGLKGHEVEDGVPGDGHAGQRAFGSASSAALRVRTHGTGLPGRDTAQGRPRGLEVPREQVR